MGDKDLPLLSNINDIRARHYLLHLKTDIESQVFEGTVFIFFEPTTACEKKGNNCVRKCFCSDEKKNVNIDSSRQFPNNFHASKFTTESIQSSDNLEENQSLAGKSADNSAENKLKGAAEGTETDISNCNSFKVVLDCSDIKVKSVSEVITDELEILHYLNPRHHRTCSFTLNIWQEKDQIPLHYSVETWCINIWKENVQGVEDFPRVICIRYETLPQGKSLLWRKDQDGNPCVFTPAAAINNRSLLPCQDPPFAMATWQAWITLPDAYYLSMTGDQRPVKFVGCIENYKESWLIGHSVFKDCNTEEFIQGSTVYNPEIQEKKSNTHCFYYHTTMVLPIATIAIAIGKWKIDILSQVKCMTGISSMHLLKDNSIETSEINSCRHYEYPCHIQSKDWNRETSISLVYPLSFSEAVRPLASFLPFALHASKNLLGTYPCHRLEVVIVPKCFASLGLASPNIIFLSPTMVMDDPAAYIRLGHEISHAWFGINIGAQDWTEEWISEGFATYMEDSVYAQAVLLYQELLSQQDVCENQASQSKGTTYDGSQLNCDSYRDGFSVHSTIPALSLHKAPRVNDLEELSDLRALIRYRTLTSELENSSEDLQKLRPMQGATLEDESGVGYVKDGRNPEKAFLQVHYLKGYFLLKYLSKVIGRKTFDSIIKDYVYYYHGQLVLSEQILDFFINAYPEVSEKGITRELLYEDWLNHPGLNPYITETYSDTSNELIRIVKQHFDYWLHLSRTKKSSVKKFKIDLPKLYFPDQLVLLLEYMLELTAISSKVLHEMYRYYEISSQNADVRHRWCELAILHNFPDVSEVRRFLIEDQAMGVYLYGELIISGRKKHRILAEELYGMVKGDMDENVKVTVSSMLYGESV